MSEENENSLFGKPWANAFVYKTFKGADNKRNAIIAEGKQQAKVKRKPDGQFVVKTRNLEVPKKTKKVKKTKKAKKQKRSDNEG